MEGGHFREPAEMDSCIVNVGVTIDKSVSRFGSSGYFNGRSYLSIGPSADLNVKSSDFTAEALCYFTDVTKNTSRVIIGQGATSDSNYSWGLQWIKSVGGLYFYISESGKTVPSETQVSYTWTPTINTLYHIACVRYGIYLYIFINGVKVATKTMASGVVPFESDTVLSVGANKIETTPANLFIGNIEEVRFSIGIARWISDFTPSTARYSLDSYTKLLLHMTDGELNNKGWISRTEEDYETEGDEILK